MKTPTTVKQKHVAIKSPLDSTLGVLGLFNCLRSRSSQTPNSDHFVCRFSAMFYKSYTPSSLHVSDPTISSLNRVQTMPRPSPRQRVTEDEYMLTSVFDCGIFIPPKSADLTLKKNVRET